MTKYATKSAARPVTRSVAKSAAHGNHEYRQTIADVWRSTAATKSLQLKLLCDYLNTVFGSRGDVIKLCAFIGAALAGAVTSDKNILIIESETMSAGKSAFVEIFVKPLFKVHDTNGSSSQDHNMIVTDYSACPLVDTLPDRARAAAEYILPDYDADEIDRIVATRIIERRQSEGLYTDEMKALAKQKYEKEKRIYKPTNTEAPVTPVISLTNNIQVSMSYQMEQHSVRVKTSGRRFDRGGLLAAPNTQLLIPLEGLKSLYDPAIFRVFCSAVYAKYGLVTELNDSSPLNIREMYPFFVN